MAETNDYVKALAGLICDFLCTINRIFIHVNRLLHQTNIKYGFGWSPARGHTLGRGVRLVKRESGCNGGLILCCTWVLYGTV